MKLSDIAKKPQLIEVTIDTPEIVQDIGEPVVFWTWDRQPMDVFMRLASVDNTNTRSMIEAVRELVLDEHGQPVLVDGVTLPTRVMLAVITKIVEDLGKS
jgi:hypothetical protein